MKRGKPAAGEALLAPFQAGLRAGAGRPMKAPFPPASNLEFFPSLSPPWGHKGKNSKPLLPCLQGEGKRGARAPAGRGERGEKGRGRRNEAIEGGSGGGYSKRPVDTSTGFCTDFHCQDPRGSSPKIFTRANSRRGWNTR